MDIKEILINNKPRENSGSISSSRFDFQKDWSICQLLEYHKKCCDYLFIFDFNEDLLILDSETKPNKISFYQIKGDKSKNWTIERLIKSKKNKNGDFLLSILGKLYECKSKYDLKTDSLNFISNARFSVKLKDGSSGLKKDNICILEIDEKDREKIKKKIKAEFKLSDDPIYEDITFLKVTELSLDDSSNHTKGKLSDFLYNANPEGKFTIPALYQSLFDEVKRRTSYDKEINTYEELIDKKSIGKSMLDNWLNQKLLLDFDELWKRIEIGLSSDGIAINDLKKIRSSWTTFELAMKNPNDELLKSIIKKINELYIKIDDSKEIDGKGIVETLNKILSEYLRSPIIQTVYDDYIIKVIILFELYG